MKDKSKYKRKPKSKDNKSNRVSESCETKVSKEINDASYYFSNPLIKDQLTNVSFNEFTGTPNATSSLYDGIVEPEKIPFAMRIALNPSAGFTQDEGDTTMGNALNLASLSLYTRLSANNAKTTNYAPQDITMLLLGMGSLISLTGHITRAFGTAYLYNQRNRAYPREIMEVLGVDYDDLMNNYANYRARFNTMMVAAAKIPIPANITYFKKCSELFSGIYLDMGGSDMAQSYVFTPDSLWLFNETDYEEGTFLETFIVTEEGSTKSMNVLLEMLNLMIGAMLNSVTLNSIYSDVLRLANKEGLPLYQFAAIPDNYVVLPQYVPEIRLWINNLTIMGRPVSAPTDTYTLLNNVYPDVDSNKVRYRPQFKVDSSKIAGYLTPYLNFDYGNPSNDDIVMATRLCSVPKLGIVEGEFVTESVALPDHYVTYIKCYGGKTEVVMNTYTQADYLTIILSSFDWSPMFHTVAADGQPSAFFGDLNYFTTIDYKYASRLHDATYLGLFEIR